MSEDLSWQRFDKWALQYRPYTNALRDWSAYAGYYFDTEDRDYIAANYDPAQVWTLCEEGGNTWIEAGYRWANRIGYFITQEKHAYDLSITLEEEEEAS